MPDKKKAKPLSPPPEEDSARQIVTVTASGVTRRSFLTRLSASGIAVSAVPLLQSISAAQVETSPAPPATPGGYVPPVPVTLNVNGRDYHLNLEPRVTLLDALREQLQLFGTKKGCDHGQCGACTVHVNGRRVNSCLTFAIMHQGDQITTIEGLAQERRAASGAGGVSGTRWISVRLLHVGPDHVGRGVVERALRRRR